MTESNNMSGCNIAVIGCGGWGKNIARTVHGLGHLGAIVDPGDSGRATAAEVAPGVPVHADIDAVLNDAAIEGVMIATPAETHFAVAMQCLDAGKDVFVEKPMATEVADALAMVGRSDELGRVLMVGHLLEYHPAIARLEQLVQEGCLGEIQYVISNRLNLGKIRTEENALWSFAPHDLSVILRLLSTMPEEVVTTGGSWISPGIADVTVTQMRFPSGARAHVFVSWLHPFKEQKLVVVGSRGMATFCDVTKELVLHDKHVEWTQGQPVPVRGEGTSIAFPKDMPLEVECAHFIECVAGDAAPRTDGRNGLRVLSLLHDAQRSLEAGGMPVECKPMAEAAHA